MQPALPDLSISIINTNNREITLDCLKSVFENAGALGLEVIVVNNSCTDGSKEAIQQRFPQVKIIDAERMQGFSTNNNLALREASGRYWMLLNDDTIVQQKALQVMVDFLDEHYQAGVVGAALLNRDGTAQYCYDFTPHPIYEGLRPLSEYILPHPKSSGEPLETGFVCGAAIMARATAVQEVGLLDTRFDPLYSEEVDWCYRFKQAGWKIYHLPQAQVIHLGEVSKRRSSKQRYERIYAKKAVFFRKHYGETATWVYKITLMCTNLIKAFIWLILWALRRPEAHQEFDIHWNVARRAFSY